MLLVVRRCNLCRVRHAISKAFGYDPDIENFDQKPFHMNEAGSKYQKTLAYKGGEVELKELHSATRARWTCLTWCISSPDRARQIPPCECLFRGASLCF
jgi:hypothetical protein